MGDAAETRLVSFMPEVGFVEADGDGWNFLPCEGTSSESDGFESDKILFRGEYVCADDPRLQQYARELGVCDLRGWRPRGYWRDVEKQTLEVFGKVFGPKWLEDGNEAQRLIALDYAEEHLEEAYPHHFYEKEEALRNSVISLLQSDYGSLEVKIKAVDVLSEALHQYWGRYVDKKADDAIHGAFRRERSPELQKALVRSRFFTAEDLIGVITNPTVDMEVREEAVLCLAYRMHDTEEFEFFRDLARGKKDLPEELQIAAFGTFIAQTWPKLPIPSGHYRITSMGDKERADHAVFFLRYSDFGEPIWRNTFGRGLIQKTEAWLTKRGADINMDDVIALVQESPKE